MFHSYHHDKVKEEDKPAFCKLSGTGLLVFGAGIALSGIMFGITEEAWVFIVTAIGAAAGSSMMIYAVKKYNK